MPYAVRPLTTCPLRRWGGGGVGALFPQRRHWLSMANRSAFSVLLVVCWLFLFRRSCIRDGEDVSVRECALEAVNALLAYTCRSLVRTAISPGKHGLYTRPASARASVPPPPLPSPYPPAVLGVYSRVNHHTLLNVRWYIGLFESPV